MDWRSVGGGKARRRRRRSGAFLPRGRIRWRQESIERATVVYRKGPVAREEEQSCARSTTAFSRTLCPGTRRIFATVSPRHARTRYESRLRSRGYKCGGGRGGERGGSRPRMHTHARASGVQVIRAISSKFRSNEISRVVVSPSLSISLFVPGFTVYTNSVYTRALLELPASPMVFLTVFIYHGANQHDQRFVLNAIR